MFLFSFQIETSKPSVSSDDDEDELPDLACPTLSLMERLRLKNVNLIHDISDSDEDSGKDSSPTISKTNKPSLNKRPISEPETSTNKKSHMSVQSLHKLNFSSSEDEEPKVRKDELIPKSKGTINYNSISQVLVSWLIHEIQLSFLMLSGVEHCKILFISITL